MGVSSEEARIEAGASSEVTGEGVVSIPTILSVISERASAPTSISLERVPPKGGIIVDEGSSDRGATKGAGSSDTDALTVVRDDSLDLVLIWADSLLKLEAVLVRNTLVLAMADFRSSSASASCKSRHRFCSRRRKDSSFSRSRCDSATILR